MSQPGSQRQREVQPMKNDPLLQAGRDLHREPSAGQAGAFAMFPQRVGARLLHELRRAVPPTIFFFVGFNFIVLTTNLLVADYAAAVSSFMLATLAALVERSRGPRRHRRHGKLEPRDQSAARNSAAPAPPNTRVD